MIEEHIQKEELTYNKRRQKIIDFLSSNQGCNKELAIKNLSNYISKKTFNKYLDELIKENFVRAEKEKPNSRDYKLFLYNENPIIVISKELEEFKLLFFDLLQVVNRVFGDLGSIYQSQDKKTQFAIRLTEIIFYRNLPLNIINYLIKIYLIKILFILPSTVKDKAMIKQINSFIFTEIAEIIMAINQYNSIKRIAKSKKDLFELSDFENFDLSAENLFDKIVHVHIMEAYEMAGIRKEFEKVVDKLWLINSDVQKYLHPEALEYQLDYKYGKDDWRTYIEILNKNKEKIAQVKKEKDESLKKFISEFRI